MGSTVKTVITTPPTTAPSFTTIGTVGSVGQIAAGHVLASGSFPSAAVGANLSWYMMNALTDASGNGRTLTNVASTPFSAIDIFGNAGNANFNGSTQWLSSTDALFDPGPTDFTCGGWFYPTGGGAWAGGSNKGLFGQFNYGSGYSSWFVSASPNTTSLLYIGMTTDGTTVVYPIAFPISTLSGYHHLAIKHVASTKTWYLYIDGKLQSNASYTGTLFTAGSGHRSFAIGAVVNAYSWAGTVDEFFFCNGTAFSDNAIAKIYASKYTHSLGLTSLNQKWYFIGTNSGQTRELYDVTVDMQPNDLYFDVSDEQATTQIAMIPIKIS